MIIQNKNEVNFFSLPEDMLDNPQILKADSIAENLHINQYRKHKKDKYPYIIHPRMVATILYELGYDEDVIVAGLLHDTVEDCEYSLTSIQSDFNNHVAYLVEKLTNIAPEHLSKEEQKEINNQHVLSGNNESMTIKVVDIGCNAKSIFENFSPNSAKRWFKSKQDVINKIVIDNPVLLQEVKDIINHYQSQLLTSPSIKSVQ